jgi:hypothetical protein
MPKWRDMNELQIFFLLVGIGLFVQGQILMAILPFFLALSGDIEWHTNKQDNALEETHE